MSDSPAAHDPDLPWLQEVDDEDAPSGISARAMLAGFLLVVVAAAVVAAAFFWLGRREAVVTGAAPELIRAPEEPYKVKPDDPGGLDVAGESQTAFQTSAGQDIDSRLDVPRDTGTQQQTPPERLSSTDSKAPATAEPARAAPPTPSGASGSVIQLGAYRNTAQAERAWTALSTRFGALSGLTKMVVPYSAGGSSGYRLRAAAASPEQAREVCRALEAAGESCFVAR